jgi:hypothetical protein
MMDSGVREYSAVIENIRSKLGSDAAVLEVLGIHRTTLARRLAKPELVTKEHMLAAKCVEAYAMGWIVGGEA